jgi:hypothetical protein
MERTVDTPKCVIPLLRALAEIVDGHWETRMPRLRARLLARHGDIVHWRIFSNHLRNHAFYEPGGFCSVRTYSPSCPYCKEEQAAGRDMGKRSDEDREGLESVLGRPWNPFRIIGDWGKV